MKGLAFTIGFVLMGFILTFAQNSVEYNNNKINSLTRINNFDNNKNIVKKEIFSEKNLKIKSLDALRNNQISDRFSAIKSVQEEFIDSSYNYLWDQEKKEWYLRSKTIKTFDSNKGTYIEKIFRWYNQKWVTHYQKIYLLDNYNNITQITEEYWDAGSMDWLLGSKTIYNDWGLETEELYKKWDDTLKNFVDGYRFVSTYKNDTLLTEKIAQEFNSVSQKWENAIQTKNTYNSNNLKTSHIELIWNNVSGNWFNFYSETYEFENFGDLTTVTAQEWDTATKKWTNLFLTGYSYDNMGNRTQDITKIWVKNAWINRLKFVYKINDLYKPTEELGYVWDKNSGKWIDTLQTTYSYNADGNEINYLQKYYANGKWINYSNESRSYNSEGLPIEMLTERWDFEKEEWKNFYRVSLDFYSSGSLKERVESLWDPSTKEWSKSFYVKLNLNGAASEEFIRNWDDSLKVFTSGDRTIMTYGPDGKIQETIQQRWDTENKIWVNDVKFVHYVYFTSVEDNTNKKFSNTNFFSVISNPLQNSILRLNAMQATFENYQINIFDNQGRLISTNKGVLSDTQINIDVSGYPGGVYFIWAVAGMHSGRIKVLIMKSEK